jgi:glycosyltransferase XagB
MVVVQNIFVGIYLLVTVAMALQALFNVRLQLFIWEKPESGLMNMAPTVYLNPCLSFTIMLPARHEEDIYQNTIQKVYDLNYPKELMQIIPICSDDDEGTIAEAQKKMDQLGDPAVQLLIYTNKPTSKPRGLNHALSIAKGDIVTIFDAEDEPHPDILNIINTIMLNEEVDVVQGGVQLMNWNTKWFCFLNVLEYFFWFKSSLHFFSRIGMTPLGGNTVFIRRELMEQIGGWDETTLTEDADLGIRLSLSHSRIRIMYDDEFVTREETPHTIEQFIKQRTRWNQGFIQILLAREWLKLESLGKQLLAFYVLISSEIQAFFACMIPVALITGIFWHPPLWIAMVSFIPAYIFVLALFIQMAGLREFLKAHGHPWSWKDAGVMLLAFYPYQILLGIGAIRAVYRHFKGVKNWEKTAHIGQHLQKAGV